MTKSGGFSRLTARAKWVDEIAKVGKRIGTEDEWRAFANDVLSQLAGAYTRGWRAQNAYIQRVDLLRPLARVRKAIVQLRDVVDHDPVLCQRFGLTPDGYRLACDSFLLYIDRAVVNINPWRRSDSPRPGRQSRIAIEITEMLAIEYYRHFKKMPGVSKEKKKSPFTHVCSVVERILESTRHPNVWLGYEARWAGIDRAALTVLRELHNLGPDDGLTVSDPRKYLEYEKNLQAGKSARRPSGVFILRRGAELPDDFPRRGPEVLDAAVEVGRSRIRLAT
jgi:hypothetical protein